MNQTASRYCRPLLACVLIFCTAFPALEAQEAHSASGIPQASADPAGKLVLVNNGTSVAPIVIYQDAPMLTREVADVLADYVEKTSGARPEVIEGEPDPIPDHAIWVGYQPVLDKLFPDLDLAFHHPEEILVAANANHLLIAGRDVWDPDNPIGQARGGKPLPGVQREYGTINAVYTFIRDGLGVRWLWPGDLGEDLLEQRTLAFTPFEHRHHPQIRMRDNIFRYSGFGYGGSPYGVSEDWVRAQRLQLDSLEGNIGGHAFTDWWERFHETNPEYFALQPDGTRSLSTLPKRVKVCHSNPAVWEQWVEDTAALIEANPSWTVFDASPNDGGYSGHCVCDACQAWDHPDGMKVWTRWASTGKEVVAQSDRQVTFANKVARMLAERYPERNDMVGMLAYGTWRSPPVEAVPDENVAIINVANIFWGLDATNKDGSLRSDWFAEWGATGAKQIWRPNTGAPAGWNCGLPDIPIGRIVEAMQFVAEQGCIGIFIDSVWEIWSTQGPLYYAMAHVAWDPAVDWQAVMDDYYQRGFGPAAPEVKAYWTLLEESRNRKVDEYPGESNGYAEVYNEDFFRTAYDLLDRAAAKAEGAPAKYKERIAFVRVGLDHTRILAELRDLSGQMLLTDGKDEAIAEATRAKWDEMKANCEVYPKALNWMVFRGGRRMTRNGLFHPDWLDQAKSQHAAQWKQVAAEAAGVAQKRMKSVELEGAEQAGWELVLQDTFDRDELGDTWDVVAGNWRVENGALHGQGALLTAQGIPGGDAIGFQRLEFKVATTEDLPRVSDMSSLLHATRPAEDDNAPWDAGYFFQFGGKWNSMHRILRRGETLVSESQSETVIDQEKLHHIIVENDGGRLSLFVDGENILTAQDEMPLLGQDADRAGFYFFTPFTVHEVKIYVKRLSSGLDTDAEDVQ